ncbi:hypothetical protein [Rickettsiella endosymbiont of Miltochrista miniata]|uniref:hypothetical protein n=1 Tax=Rickettsiella endosymbiont of Miltochrista miniata TaxID=3066239 RepID=UPI00313F066D
MLTGNTSLTNASSTFSNSTSDLCFFHTVQQLKGLTLFELKQEEKLDELQKNVECALGKYNLKVKRTIHEKPLTFLERTLFTLASVFKNTSSPVNFRTSEPKVISLTQPRNF